MNKRRKIGGNINGQIISDHIITTWTRASGARTHLIINESKVAAQLLGHTERVIFRAKGNVGIVDDDKWHHHDPRTFARARHNLAPHGCLLHASNEPGSNNLALQNTWSLVFVDECVRLGRKPVILNNYVLHPTQGAAGWRVYKPSVLAAWEAGGSVGIHIYFDKYVRNSLDAFRVIADIRDVCGDGQIDVTEYGCAPKYDPHQGFGGVISEAVYADELIEGVERYGDDRVDWMVYIRHLGRSAEL